MAKKNFVRNSLIIGWVVLIIGFIIDISISNQVVWFTRAGAMLCLFSIMAEFRLQQLDNLAFREDWRKRTTGEKVFNGPMYEEDNFYKGMKMFAHISMIIGTCCWALGDILVSLI